MARPSVRLVTALRETAARLRRPETVYRWSRFSLCNCGHLAQTVTGLEPGVIESASHAQGRDWGDQARAFAGAPSFAVLAREAEPLGEGTHEPEGADVCSFSRRSLDDIVAALLSIGLEPNDIDALERLNDCAVRRRLGADAVELSHADRDHVIAYLEAWADLLAEQLEREASRLARGLDVELPLAAE